MTSLRQVSPSPILQGVNEQIVYKLIVTPWASSPTGVTATLTDITGGSAVDVSAAKLVGSPSVSGDEISLPAVRQLQPGSVYRLSVRFSAGGQTLEAYGILMGE
jgi:hypothetical protein